MTKRFKRSSPPLSRGLPTDAPISKAEQDLLGRTGFANELAEVIASQRTPESLVLALRGDWGSGKSSLKNLIVGVLQTRFQKQVKILEFNPWQWGSDEKISRAFFEEIAAALGQADLSLRGRRRAYKFREYAKRLTSLSGTLKLVGEKTPSAIGWLSGFGLLTAGAGLVLPSLPVTKISAVLLMGSGIIAIFSKVLTALGAEKDQGKPLELVRADLDDQLRSLPRNLLVVVDDIDRLEPDQIRLVLRLVKSNANLPRITYLLLFQRSIVEEALKPLSNQDGRRYLEKIVQTSFDVPSVEGARVETAVLKGLDKLLSSELSAQNGYDSTRWGNIWYGGLRKLFRNLRDVQRFFGALEVHLNLHRGRRFLEINIVDFIAIEALRNFEPDVFSAISHAKILLAGETDSSDTTRKSLLVITESLEIDRREAVNFVLGQLFPIFGWALGGSFYNSDWNSEWLRERRICSQRHFDRYFMLRLPDGEISDSEFRDFLEINEKIKIAEAFEDFNQRGILPILLARLDEIKTDLPIENINALLPSLVDIGDYYDNSAGFSTSTPFIATWRIALWYLKSVTDITHRGCVFLAAMNHSAGLAVPITLIELEGKRREEERSHDPATLMDIDLQRAKDLILQKIRTASATPAVFLVHLHLIRLLYFWRTHGGENEPREWIAKVVGDGTLLPKLLKAFTLTQQSHTFGDYVSRSTKTFSLEWFRDFSDLDQVNAMVGQLDRLGLAEDEAEAVAIYLDAVSKEK
ncbi:KAP family P-loop NTPase fold protein [Gluconobacter kondonii]|uniref:KAP family P-loop NTPase fold protein n=1 Tax=Gluconobacter kondonii TaxID=941463 RepID=UPI0031FF37AD